jgi:hypothetical protein
VIAECWRTATDTASFARTDIINLKAPVIAFISGVPGNRPPALGDLSDPLRHKSVIRDLEICA